MKPQINRANGPRISVHVAEVKSKATGARAYLVEVKCGDELQQIYVERREEVRRVLDGVAITSACINAAITDAAGHETSARDWMARRLAWQSPAEPAVSGIHRVNGT